jgi:hypothetical protein
MFNHDRIRTIAECDLDGGHAGGLEEKSEDGNLNK